MGGTSGAKSDLPLRFVDSTPVELNSSSPGNFQLEQLRSLAGQSSLRPDDDLRVASACGPGTMERRRRLWMKSFSAGRQPQMTVRSSWAILCVGSMGCQYGLAQWSLSVSALVGCTYVQIVHPGRSHVVSTA